MNQITKKGYGKINLTLDVVGLMPNGYHELDMVMQTVDLYDEVTVKKTDSGISVSSNTGKIPNDESNLAYKAAKVLMDEFGVGEGVDISIQKRIPIAAGMAGGSADCAATLKAVNELFDLGLSDQELCDRGVKLGADVPYCIMEGTRRAQGIGEVLTKLPAVPQAHIVLAKPDISVSTAFVYGEIDKITPCNKPDTEAMIEALENGDIKKVASNICNVLEEVTIPKHGIVSVIKDALTEKGALGAMMSGSGPTVFGIFDDRKKAEDAANALETMEGMEQVHLTGFYNK